MLAECLVYIAISAVLVGVGSMLFLRCMDTAKNCLRNADDITGALSVGERWRADLRRAIETPSACEPGRADFVIPVDGGHVVYLFENGAIWRSETGDATWARLLDRVETASWDSEKRKFTTAWHFDLEMQTKKKNARLRPLFSFVGVPPAEDTK
jgi:hypothetical protein